MRLVPPSMEYDAQIQAYRKEFLDHGGSMDGCGSLRRFETTKEWLDQVEAMKRPETTPLGYVPMTQYLYVRESDDKVVGVIQIRHYFNEFLEKYAGHIGYSVAPSERRKGYATQMLKAVLPVCKALGIEKVLISCVKGNEGSRGTILNNGGVYESTVYLEERDVYLERYWIDLSGDKNIHLEKVNTKNFDALIDLEPAKAQREYVADNIYSLAEAYATIAEGRFAQPFGIYVGEVPVGFLMIGYNIDDEADLEKQYYVKDSYLIWRFMIDEKYQNKGYGKEAMRLALEYVRSFPCGEAEYCWISYEPENEKAKGLYQSFGFVEEPEIPEGWSEIPAVLKL